MTTHKLKLQVEEAQQRVDRIHKLLGEANKHLTQVKNDLQLRLNPTKVWDKHPDTKGKGPIFKQSYL